MLKEYKSMTQEEMYTLVHEIYIEGCMENAREKYPDATDLTTAIQQEEDSFVCFLQDFFTLPENTYYVLEKDNMPVSAARLSKINDFYYLEALETPPKYRKKGYASELLNEMITHLHQEGSVDIRDCGSLYCRCHQCAEKRPPVMKRGTYVDLSGRKKSRQARAL